MSQGEYDEMVKTGYVQESISGTTHVARPADISAYIKQAKPGSLYVEFNVLLHHWSTPVMGGQKLLDLIRYKGVWRQ